MQYQLHNNANLSHFNVAPLYKGAAKLLSIQWFKKKSLPSFHISYSCACLAGLTALDHQIQANTKSRAPAFRKIEKIDRKNAFCSTVQKAMMLILS